MVGLRAITFKLKTERAKLSFASKNVEVCYAGRCRSKLSFAPVSEGYSAVSASGNDEVYSSSGTLQLGNNASHKTIIKGTLEVPKPKTGNEAANKSYVDGVGAMVMAAAQLNMMYNPDSVLDLGFGLGSMDNENAIAVGLGGVLPDSNMRYSLSATYSDYTAQVSYGAGLSFSLK